MSVRNLDTQEAELLGHLRRISPDIDTAVRRTMRNEPAMVVLASVGIPAVLHKEARRVLELAGVTVVGSDDPDQAEVVRRFQARALANHTGFQPPNRAQRRAAKRKKGKR